MYEFGHRSRIKATRNINMVNNKKIKCIKIKINHCLKTISLQS